MLPREQTEQLQLSVIHLETLTRTSDLAEMLACYRDATSPSPCAESSPARSSSSAGTVSCYRQAARFLGSLADPQFEAPLAIFGLGRLIQGIATRLLTTAPENKNQIDDVFIEASHYYCVASEMAEDGTLAPARAANALAALYMEGRLLLEGEYPFKKGLRLLQRSADAGWPEAQLNLAFLRLGGIGVVQSVAETSALMYAVKRNPNLHLLSSQARTTFAAAVREMDLLLTSAYSLPRKTASDARAVFPQCLP